ncbi:tannase/feruloyl esterase family alpha/beta hydrolase [Nitrospirillum amazonense]|uniref:tannase/feruloyl esterase family alpha/beta hydrolase n=1 Tax=Nitrospirillum amazonense TaxID=28077 RepID=UPI0024123AF4|nr:tannase/feruloyl esterase family alpha/beta hydrolase [Nitrospirillum amazonense]MDG3442779.1 tannase/feruloyl esterase family alpha/beta hydrolase [Nitrospirillum amazonense]
MRVMTWTGAAAGALLTWAVTTQAAQAAPPTTDCASLAGRSLPEARILSAEPVAAGPYKAPDGTVTFPNLPAFCRVTAMAETDVKVEVWLPETAWNGRFQGVGNGGFAGNFSYYAMGPALRAGYAVAGTDTGHGPAEGKPGTRLDWMHDPTQLANWGHNSIHRMTVAAKAIVAARYGTPAAKAYFEGCSTGGAQAMTEAEYFPGDYDGIHAGAPGMNYTRLMMSFLWSSRATLLDPASTLPAEKLTLLHQAVLNACDAADGVKDGLIENPQACRFDPAALQCKPDATDTSACLTAPQVTAVRALYAGPRNPRTGEAIYPGLVPGSEWGWDLQQGKLLEAYVIPLFQNMVYDNLSWRWQDFDFDRDVTLTDEKVGATITAVSPDLSAFKARGGKLIMSQGWADQLNAQTYPIQYYQAVAGTSDPAQARARLGGYFRLFMVPGMGHCYGGPGPNRFDAVTALRAWVEQGKAPDRLVAAKHEKDLDPTSAVLRTRPLCPYPAVARWIGKGSSDEAANFTCR